MFQQLQESHRALVTVRLKPKIKVNVEKVMRNYSPFLYFCEGTLNKKSSVSVENLACFMCCCLFGGKNVTVPNIRFNNFYVMAITLLLPFITESALALNKQKELGLVVEPFEPIASGQSQGMWGPEI